MLLTLLLGVGAGASAAWLRTPLPWVIGPLIVVGAAGFVGLPVVAMNPLRPAMSAVIGTMIGSSFAPDFLSHVFGWLVTLAGLLVCSALGASVSMLLLRRLPGLSRETAFFSSMPGGIVEMSTLCRERGGDERVVALVHAGRIFLVVMSLPILLDLITGHPVLRAAPTHVRLVDIDIDAVVWFGVIACASFAGTRFLHIPARFMLIPMTLSAVVHLVGWTDFRLPLELVAFAQIVIGSSIGARFAGMERGLVLKSLAVSAFSSMVMILMALICAELAHLWTGREIDSLLLAYVPGGLAEMSLIAVAMQLDVAFVVAHHVLRVVAVVLLAAWVFDGLLTHRARP